MNNSKPNLHFIMNNWLYKLIAVLSALTIWAFVTVTQNPLVEARHTVSVEPRGLAENLSIDNPSYQVNVRVQGKSANVNSLRPVDIEAYVDFTGLMAGEVTVPVVVEVPKDVVVIGQNLTTITVELKQKRAERFPLEVNITGEPAANYKALPEVVSPADVRLRGTDDYIRRVGKVYVEANIQDIEEGFEKDLSVIVQDVDGSDITAMFTVEPRVARVVIPVTYNRPEKTVAVRVPITGKPALGYQLSLVSVTPSTVRVFGDINRLQALYYVETAPLDITDMRYDESFTLELVLGNGFSAERETVTVAVQIEPANYVTYHKTLLLANNVGVDLTAEVQQQSIEITVYGPETFIATLDEADIVPYVDCADLGEGEYTLPIRVSLPANIEQLNVTPDTAEVTIYSIASGQDTLPEDKQTPGGSDGQ